ncbi:hypothetical protein M0R45_007961 [Rubus argutus]
MGKKIADDEESHKEPGERKRLWYYKDVLQVLTRNTGTDKIEGIIVKMPTADEICLNSKCFKRMKNLKIFINVNARFYGKVDYYPEQLRILEWPEFPLQSLPSNFNMNELIQLNMPRSRFSSLGEGFKPLQNLKSMNLRGCKFLTEIPDLSECPNLERMDLGFCESLVKVHDSVGFLEKLVDLNLCECSNLVKLPRKVNWRSLQHLDLQVCRRLESFPEIEGEMKCLTQLYLILCSAIKELPASIGNLINLRRLCISGCENLTNLPFSIYQLQAVKEFELDRCPKLKTIPNKGNSAVLMPTGSKEDRVFNITLNRLTVNECSSLSDNVLTDFLDSLDCASTLKSLDLSQINIVSLPECLCKFIHLRTLNLDGCRNLVEIPQLPPSIEYLHAMGCVLLERISKLSKILKREESQMIKCMVLTDCCKLMENLVKEANVGVNDDCEVVDAPFLFFLYCRKSEFTITFPGREIPKWFSRQVDFQGFRQFDFFIEVLPNFKWENTGLALCVLKQQSDTYGPKQRTDVLTDCKIISTDAQLENQ